MKKILYIDQTGKLGGAEKSLLYLLQNIDRDKYELFLITSENGPLIDKAKDLNISTNIIKLPNWIPVRTEILNKKIFNPFSLIYNLLSIIPIIFKFAKYIRKNEIDIVHTNSRNAYVYGGLAAKLARAKHIPHIRIYLPSGMTRKIFNHLMNFIADKIIVISSAVGKMFSCQDKVELIFNGVDLKEFSTFNIDEKNKIRKELNIANQDKIITILGRLDRWKGQDIFIKAASEVVKKYNNVKFLIVGDTLFYGNEYKNELKTLVKDLGLQNDVIFTGFRDDVPQIFFETDVCVHCSKSPEPFGRVIIEAMAMKTPVIATEMGGPLDIINHEESGLLISPSKPKLLANKICDLLENESLLKEMGSNAKKEVNKKFSIINYVKNIEKVYSRILNRER